MDLWFGKVAFILGFFALGHIRDPHIKRNKSIPLADNRKSKFEIFLLILVTIGSALIPFLWIIFGIFPFANYSLYPINFFVGVGTLIFSLWLFKRSHDDLGTNWSVTLQVRESHTLIKHGIYKKIRHPMYAAIFLYTLSQVFLLSNWLAGPAGIISFLILYLGRIKSEEKMMLDKFGIEYELYMKETRRLW